MNLNSNEKLLIIIIVLYQRNKSKLQKYKVGLILN